MNYKKIILITVSILLTSSISFSIPIQFEKEIFKLEATDMEGNELSRNDEGVYYTDSNNYLICASINLTNLEEKYLKKIIRN